jgi:hypothetical protein
MHENDNARPGAYPGAGASSTSSWLVDDRYFTADPVGRQQACHVHELGPKALAHLLDQIRRDPTNIRRHVEWYAGLNPVAVEAAGGRDWLEPRAVVRLVRRRA